MYVLSEPIFTENRFSSLTKPFSVTALVFRFIDKFRKRKHDTLHYREVSKLYWIKFAQNAHFTDEIYFLKSCTGKIVPKLVNNLNLFLDGDNLLRARSKLNKCWTINYNLINPILLPKNIYLTELFVISFHVKCKHLGIASTMNTLRNHAWLLVAKGSCSLGLKCMGAINSSC